MQEGHASSPPVQAEGSALDRARSLLRVAARLWDPKTMDDEPAPSESCVVLRLTRAEYYQLCRECPIEESDKG